MTPDAQEYLRASLPRAARGTSDLPLAVPPAPLRRRAVYATMATTLPPAIHRRGRGRPRAAPLPQLDAAGLAAEVAALLGEVRADARVRFAARWQFDVAEGRPLDANAVADSGPWNPALREARPGASAGDKSKRSTGPVSECTSASLDIWKWTPLVAAGGGGCSLRGNEFT
jgi:hypothetical protein